MAHGGVFVALFPADLIVARQVVSGLDHAGDHAETLDGLAHHSAPGQAVMHA